MNNSNAVSGSVSAGRGFLSRNAIKYILIVLMLLDHTCFVFQDKAGVRSGFNKWFFYIFFPAHMLILALIKWFVL